jgi:hypothetical protein
MDAAAVRSLVGDAVKKSGLVWIQPATGGRAFGVWHVWQDGHLYVLTGPGEQLLPPPDKRMIVITRSKDSGARVVSWVAATDTVAPGSPEWDAVLPSLLGGRLNLRDADTAGERWARECTVYRFAPTGEVMETAAEPSTTSHAAPPPAAPQRTRVPRPLHLRGRPSQRTRGRLP